MPSQYLSYRKTKLKYWCKHPQTVTLVPLLENGHQLRRCIKCNQILEMVEKKWLAVVREWKADDTTCPYVSLLRDRQPFK